MVLGAKYQYLFLGQDAEKLSKMSIDDILNSEEIYNNLPYLSSSAQLARSTNQSVKQIKEAVDLVDSIKIEYNRKRGEFTVFNFDNPQNRFSFRIDDVKSSKGYDEAKIIVDKNVADNSELLIKDLRECMDNLTVPDGTENALIRLADSKVVSKASGQLTVASGVLDFVDLVTVLASDIKADGEAGDDFSRELFGTAGAWAGDYVGGAVGAKAGASLGLVPWSCWCCYRRCTRCFCRGIHYVQGYGRYR